MGEMNDGRDCRTAIREKIDTMERPNWIRRTKPTA